MTIATLRLRHPCAQSLLWERPLHVPPALTRALGPSGPASIESLHDLLIGGWFEMSPHAGLPGELNGSPTMLHGEAPRLPWEVESVASDRLTAAVRAVRWPLHMRRHVLLQGDQVRVRSEICNDGGAEVAITHGEHPCFDRRLFGGGRLLLDAMRSKVLAPLDPLNASLAAGEFEWPLAPGVRGGTVDLSQLTGEADGSHDHVAITLASGQVLLRSPCGIELQLSLDIDLHPHVLLWRNFGAPSAPGFGAWDVFAVEPMSAPGRSFNDGLAAGAVRQLKAGESATYDFALAARPVEELGSQAGRG